VTWELAALYIKDIATTNQTYTLAQVMGSEDDNFLAFNSTSSPFYHLIDPNWVLKLPQYECRIEGPGPQVAQRLNEQVEVSDGFGGKITVQQELLQRANYCADERTCIVENPNGTCQKYGYCTTERDSWNFQGQACQPQFSTCETYIKAGSSEKSSYLTSTLETCDASQAGCRWYSAYQTDTGVWAEDIWNATTNNLGSDGIITFGDVFRRNDLGNISYARYLNSQVETCSSGDAGCSKFLSLSSINAPSGYEATTQGVYQYVQDNEATYTDAGYIDSYGEWGLVAEKYLQAPPVYLNCPADINDPNRDIECDDYAQVCESTEVGCSLYTPVNGDPPIPAVLTNNDYCSEACVGYDQYLEVPTYFEKLINPNINGQVLNVIPTSATSCRLSEVGCEEFTNLDEVAQGGEGIKNFSYIRECILPNDPAAKVFYTWEGSDTTGYQLKTWRLEASGGAGPTGTSCDPLVDPLNCRTFIDSNGASYNIDIASVTYATDDCHPYRRSLDNTLLYGIESLSRSCNAAAVGCKEYRGNQGNVVTKVVDDDFESGTSDGWINGVNSSVSVYVGGHSLNTQGVVINKAVQDLITQGKNYTISFWARSSAPSASLTFEIQQYVNQQINRSDERFALINSARAQQIIQFTDLQPIAGSEREFGSVNLTDEWQYYRLGPVNFDRAVGVYEFLQTSAANVYLDNVIMREVTDSYYLIDDSWETPAVCDQPFIGAQLGCQAYKTNTNETVNLLGFTSLCSDSKIGCSALIDTQNNSSPFSQTYNDSNNSLSDPGGLDDVVVPDDALVFLVDNEKNRCQSKFQGCTLAGEAIIDRQSANDGQVLAFNDKYIIDNPEKYEQILCSEVGLYCEQYTNERTGSSGYYINPGNRVCEYTLLPGQTAAGWYITGTTQACDPLQIYPNQPVPTTDVNYDGWVGACSAEAAGCSQYIDPESGLDIENSSYFNLEQSVNAANCNGLVDRQRGCRLFNKVDGSPQAYTASAYSTTTPDGSTPISSVDPTDNEANMILQVQKDRTCQEWLYCRTRIQSFDSEGNRDDKCFDIGLCDSLDQNGECGNFPNVPNEEIVGEQISGATGYTSTYSVEDLRLMSGYTKAGMSWTGFTSGNGTINGYWPYHSMLQIGNEADRLYNPSFEDTITTSLPLQSPFLYWSTTLSTIASNTAARVVPDNNSASGVSAAKLSLAINSGTPLPSNLILSQNISLSPSEYILSGFIKWQNIPTGNTNIGASVQVYDGATRIDAFGFEQGYSIGWQPFSIRFSNTTNNVSIRMALIGVNEGEAFFDGLSILPALQTAETPAEVLLGQRCRLYPETNSPECNYVKGTKSYVGWPGFCVEPDPRNSAYCVNWWPVDIIKGSVAQINETPLVFSEKVPLYYCMEAIQTGGQTILAGSKSGGYAVEGNSCDNFAIPSGGWSIGNCNKNPWREGDERPLAGLYSAYDDNWGSNARGIRVNIPATGFAESGLRMWEIEKIKIDNNNNPWGWPSFEMSIANKVEPSPRPGMIVWRYDNSPFSEGEQNLFYFDMVFDATTQRLLYYAMLGDDYTGSGNEGVAYSINYYLRQPCTKLAQVGKVEPNGDIMVYPYFTRVDPYSGQLVSTLNYNYNTDSSPFGSSYQSGLSQYVQSNSGLFQDENDPTTWDSRPTEPGNQPLYVEAFNPLTTRDGSLNAGPNIRAGSPYSCVGDCTGSVCVGGTKEGNTCVDDTTAKSCYAGDGLSTGICVGSWQTPASATGNNAQNSLDDLFVRTIGLYTWQVSTSTGLWQYVRTGDGWNFTNLGQVPSIGNILVNDAATVTLVGGGTVKLSFTTNIANDQLPLRSYEIDWGDTTPNTAVQGYFNERPSPGDPHILYHSYASTPGNHTITIRVTDNWGRFRIETRNNIVIVQ
jgi:hypothetical protein